MLLPLLLALAQPPLRADTTITRTAVTRLDTLSTATTVRITVTLAPRVDTLLRVVHDTVAAPPVVVPPVVPPAAASATVTRYLADFQTYGDKLWASEGAGAGSSTAAVNVNFYDRAWAYYQAAARPEYDSAARGVYRLRADSLAVSYRRAFLEANNYRVQPHDAQLRGLVEHYRLTGDPASRAAVLGVAQFLETYFAHSDYVLPKGGESRILARTLGAAFYAWQLADSATKPVWAARVDADLALVAAWQDSTGAYPAAGQVCGGQINYMVGLLNDVLIDVYAGYRADPRIPPLVQRADDYLWRTQWRGDGSFNYASVDCPKNGTGISVGGPTSAPDLNQLLVSSFGWLYRQTGDRTWRDRGEMIFAGGVKGAFLSGSKQFTQAYTSGFRYLDWR